MVDVINAHPILTTILAAAFLVFVSVAFVWMVAFLLAMTLALFFDAVEFAQRVVVSFRNERRRK